MWSKTIVVVLLAILCGGVQSASVKFPNELDELVRLKGHLFKPSGVGTFPAVILLHGCEGVHRRLKKFAKSLTREGFVSLVLDSHGSRGVRNGCDGPSTPPTDPLVRFDARTQGRSPVR